jgi:hypothetical protein
LAPVLGINAETVVDPHRDTRFPATPLSEALIMITDD